MPGLFVSLLSFACRWSSRIINICRLIFSEVSYLLSITYTSQHYLEFQATVDCNFIAWRILLYVKCMFDCELAKCFLFHISRFKINCDF